MACAQAYASTYEGKVVGVSDGDTLTVLMSWHQVRVRLAEIDAPAGEAAALRPALEAEPIRAHGTLIDQRHDGRIRAPDAAGGVTVADRLGALVFGASGSKAVAVDEFELADDAQAIVCNGGPGRTRTFDQGIMSPLL